MPVSHLLPTAAAAAAARDNRQDTRRLRLVSHRPLPETKARLAQDQRAGPLVHHRGHAPAETTFPSTFPMFVPSLSW